MPEVPRSARAPRLILAFDFGLRRIGLAAGDTISGTASPHGTARMGPDGPDWSAIDTAIARLGPDLLVVGSPRNADGSAGRLTPATDRFAAALAARSGLPVTRVDEYASSLEAASRLRQARAAGTRQRRVQHSDIDGAAAAIILQRWLQDEGRIDD